MIFERTPELRRQLSWTLALAILAGCGSRSLVQAAEGARPNVVVILIDDMGHADMHCSGSKLYETPGLDRLAAEGMRFTQAYAACPVCSPTRAALMTGRYPARLHVTDWIPGLGNRRRARLHNPDWTKHLPLEEVTLAEMLHSAGYATAIIGKWHLGEQGFEPKRQGFDLSIAADGRGRPSTYFSPYGLPDLPEGPPGEYLTDRLTAEVEKFLAAHQQQPFFLYFSHYAVHEPLQAPENIERHYAEELGYPRPGSAAVGESPRRPALGQQDNPTYAAMVDSMSRSVDRVLRKLDETGLSNSTLVIFTSDNGGVIDLETKAGKVAVTANPPARAGKGSEYEGGVRVPLIVRWPGVVRAGATCETPVITMDLVPTILSATGTAAGEAPCDGLDLLPVFKQQAALAERPLYWHYPHYAPQGARPFGAVRQGDYRLVEFYEDSHVELYNLQDDPGEQHDLASAEPERAAQLRQQLAAWRAAVGAQMPTPNPEFGKTK